MEIIVTNQQLPTKFEDVAQFAVLAQEKLKSVKAEINAIKRLGLARDVYEQKKAEAQELAELTVRAEVKLGEITSNMPTAQGARTDLTSLPQGKEVVTKQAALKGANINAKRASHYEAMAAHPEIVEAAITEARENDDIVSRSFVLEKIKAKEKETRREQKIERKDTSKADASGYKLLCADIASGLPEIPDNSVDFIITDPPYPREYIPLYGHLSALAARVLKDGGSALVMCGQSYLPQVMNELCKELTYHWTLCYLTPGGQSPSLWQKRTNTFWKPIIWLTKGEYKGDYIGDKISSPANDKEHHHWGQSVGGFAEIVEKFTNPGQTVLDPFLGGGTTGVVCVGTKRNFIGVDIDPKCVETTRQRLMEI